VVGAKLGEDLFRVSPRDKGTETARRIGSMRLSQACDLNDSGKFHAGEYDESEEMGEFCGIVALGPGYVRLLAARGRGCRRLWWIQDEGRRLYRAESGEEGSASHD
jgi:hypothetical protein